MGNIEQQRREFDKSYSPMADSIRHDVLSRKIDMTAEKVTDVELCYI